ncbi:aldehyde dehydrogenase family protein [Deinococcus hopiensis]|uniref:Aldehyde dehydrogenase n=1 Tax=Deinococcus hopiensis KR-140 TaxID=695939 RepID=A0A1W1V9R3_9DEIO|nr:aldehyde dehydrogenase family protein [Deinococcus hopiensis]SMB89771.1 aldehyde dehydrogenase (NAD+) [Deinococcus hopiensis KR-140]
MSQAVSPPISPKLQALFDAQRAWRWRAAQTDAEARRTILRHLREGLRRHRTALADALARDLGKSRAEAEITELHPVMEEIGHTLRHLPRWMAPRPVSTPAALLGTRSEVQSQARGVTLILGPWNYPVNLTLMPLVASLAAGNTVILKPSEKAPATAEALRRLLEEVFEPHLVAVVLGDAGVAEGLTRMPFDHIFFTGSGPVGRRVLAAAAENLTGVTLELGGKSPALVHASADLDLTAQRLGWGKFLNAGQTCVAPDYALVPEALRDTFVERLRGLIAYRFGEGEHLRAGPDYGRMVDARSVERLERLTRESVAAGARVALGGEFDASARFVSPTLVTGVTPEMPLMAEELFGPVLPVLTYRTFDEALALIRRLDPPLALYTFAEDPAAVARVQNETTSGGLIVNGTIIHLSNPNLPFGGVGASGMGRYHGEYGFRTFSHERAVMVEGRNSAIRFMYPPYGRPVPRFLAWALRHMER